MLRRLINCHIIIIYKMRSTDVHLLTYLHCHHSLPISPYPGLPTSKHIKVVRQIATICTADPVMLSVKAFSISDPSVWNSLSYWCRSAQFSALWKLICLTLFTVNVKILPLSTSDLPLIHGIIQILYCDWLKVCCSNFKQHAYRGL